ncbi:hypothetical protein TNIN_257721 [Trichonephila inaurata madagascariensis]|uniref:Uncharacterized protein n=1 Tax=Trichonephila inaurata madagascariensis TaxID=2747483 RepID=A0A8X7C992_9ARAC|nr:hypothetical protein TNIN_257721 [Trichonephila inaurata madagascariensis]
MSGHPHSQHHIQACPATRFYVEVSAYCGVDGVVDMFRWDTQLGRESPALPPLAWVEFRLSGWGWPQRCEFEAQQFTTKKNLRYRGITITHAQNYEVSSL